MSQNSVSRGIAFAGDLHLSRAIYGGELPNMTGDSEFSLQQIVAHCRSEDLDLLLLGDNFDMRFPDGSLLASFLNAIQDVRVGFIQGQHDMQSIGWPGVEGHSMKSRIHLHPLDKCEVFGGSINVFGFDYTPRHKLEELLKTVPEDCEILCLHQLNKESMGLEDAWTLDMDWVPESVAMTLMGDYHGLPQDGVTNGRSWLYTGSSTMRAVGEPTSKSFVVVKRNEQSGVLEAQRIPLKTRPYIYNSLVWPNDLDDWLKAILPACDAATQQAVDSGGVPFPSRVASPLVVCRYNVEIPDAYNRICDHLAESISKQRLYLHLMPNGKFVPDAPDYVHDDGIVITAESVINEAVDRELSPVLHSLAMELVDSTDPKSVITDFKTRHQVLDDPTVALPMSSNV